MTMAGLKANDPWAMEVEGRASVVPSNRLRLRGSPQQEAFWEELADPNAGHIQLEARAGTGKSTSCREGMWRLLEQDPRTVIRYCCFNKKVADEFGEKCPPGVVVGTMHRFGLEALKDAFGSNVEKHKTYLVIDSFEGGSNLPRYLRKAIANVVSLAKNNGLRPGEEGLRQKLDDLVWMYDIETWRRQGEVVKWAALVLTRSAELTTILDFDDMLWLPVLYPVKFPGTDFLFIDECLPSWTPVLLADGSSMTIGKIVEDKLPVSVLAYDTATGTQKACRVTGWSKTLNRKPLVKIKVKWTKKKGTNTPTNFVICTTDHKVWADGRWIQAGDVRPGMTMQVETSATKVQKGKIGLGGREILSGAMSAKNEAGITGNAETSGSIPADRRGGNGHGPSLAERLMLEALGEGWVHNHVVRTGKRSEGYPHCYKIDVANPEQMIAVELDGHSHDSPSRRAADRRKEEFLRSLGWQVFRFKNRRAIQRTEECVDQVMSPACVGGDCPIDATVVSVEPVEISDDHVFDITVEDCHNFYANGILVHNCQDLNPVQHELAERLSGSGRTIVVGDPYQSIYAFRGADSGSMRKLREKLDAKVMPLTVTYRCPRSHVELARQLVPDFEAHPSAPEGEVLEGAKDLIGKATPGELVLCRANAPVVQACLHQIANLVPAVVRGRAIGESLLTIVRSIGEVPTTKAFIASLARWQAKEIDRLDAREGNEDLIEQVLDKGMSLEAIASVCDSPAEIVPTISKLFSDDDASTRVTFSSVHRAKGSEARRVTYIQIPYSEKRDRDRPPQQWELDQRRNLRYVALSRSLETLTLVS
ncbi:UvrD-helicase domain-containing protein [Singulisphaera sp. PoT]|uniref:UvrD-helicase domain-containing protein n=1 Tax=Singulisphaera sp. PoT TaxID=3411797 RepID=UPI003BF59A9C